MGRLRKYILRGRNPPILSIDAGFRMIAPGCSFVIKTPGENLKAMTSAVKGSKKSFAKGKN